MRDCSYGNGSDFSVSGANFGGFATGDFQLVNPTIQNQLVPSADLQGTAHQRIAQIKKERHQIARANGHGNGSPLVPQGVDPSG